MNRPHALVGIGVALAIALALRPGAGVQAQSAPERKDDRQITFNRDIAPIIFQSCARCHRPGPSLRPAPFGLSGGWPPHALFVRSEEHTSELQSP